MPSRVGLGRMKDEIMSWEQCISGTGNSSDEDYIVIGSTPVDESCAQVSREKQYRSQMMIEAIVYREQLIRQHGSPPRGSRVAVKTFVHEFGPYAQVVCCYSSQAGEEYALKVEGEVLSEWDNQAKRRLAELGHEKYLMSYDAGADKTSLLEELIRRVSVMDCVSFIEKAYLHGYARDRLDVETIREHIMTNLTLLDRAVDSVEDASFQELCASTRGLSGDQILRVLGQEVVDDSPPPWLHMALKIQDKPVPCLYALANDLASPIVYPFSIATIRKLLLSKCLSCLGRELEALFILEDHVGVGPGQYTAEHVISRFGEVFREADDRQTGESFCHALASLLSKLAPDRDTRSVVTATAKLFE